ncbi:MAG: MOSC domain-containing protein [Ignavibacteria bacterium]|nr:MOSC domain-containing protein [Ignavibacteria bacterium]
MPPLRLTELSIYPIKSARGISLASAQVTEHGLQYDRRWMLVDENGAFLTQRKIPRMALITVELAPDLLVVRAPGINDLGLPLQPQPSSTVRVKIWDDTVEALSTGEDAGGWFTNYLGLPCNLVYMPDTAHRTVKPKYGDNRVSFADAFPFLLISEESLGDLNNRLENPVPMNRFRPNLIVSGCRPYEEDEWHEIRIGSITFRLVKPCARCTIPGVDQVTGVQGKEPIRTLATYRSRDGKVLFGQNVVHEGTGVLSAGDHVEVVTRR